MDGATFLDGDRLSLRAMKTADHELFARLWNRQSVRNQAGWPQFPLRAADIEAGGARRDEEAQFVAHHDDRVVGFVMLHDFDWQARLVEISYLIRPDEQGNGYATEAVKLCLSYVFDELGLHKVYATVWAENAGSIRVLEKVGFQREGVLRDRLFVDGDHGDEHRFGLLESEWDSLDR